METNTGIQDELKNSGSALAGMPHTMPYSVPPAYFATLPEGMLAAIREQDITPSFIAAKQMPYNGLPVHYFDTLPADILNIAKAARQQAIIAPPPKPVKRIALSSIKWAAAALIVIALGLGSYKTLFTHTQTGTEQLLSVVPNNELHEYLQSSCRIDVDRVVNNNTLVNMQLDNKDIISYLDETGWDIVD